MPVVVANDGDVTALAGAAMAGTKGAVLGISLGTSQAGGFVGADGLLSGWLNELAFVPIDYGEHAIHDREWSFDYGTGAHYLSVEAVARLALKTDLPHMTRGSPSEIAARVLERLERGQPQAQRVFETVGTYLGYAILQYAEFYSFDEVLLAGGLTQGSAGSLLVASAADVLACEDAVLAGRVRLRLPSPDRRSVAQALAAASLPVTPSSSPALASSFAWPCLG